MDENQSPAVIDATDAVVLAPEVAPAELTPQQADQLQKCQHHLSLIGRRIAARENGLIYLYIEAGFYLLKAQEVHRVSHRETDGDTGRFLATGTEHDGGFRKWVEEPEIGISRPTAYRYMQGARNCGLTAESHIINLQAIKDTRKLNGQSLTALCRKPVDKTDQQAEVHELTDAEKAAEELAALDEEYRVTGQFLSDHVIDEQTWALLSAEKIDAYLAILSEAVRVMKAGRRKARELPAPKQP